SCRQIMRINAHDFAFYFSTIDFLYGIGAIDEYTYLYLAYVGDFAFYSCFVERFDEQGVAFAGLRINVGEPNNPINGSHFIQDTRDESRLYQKLTTALWY
uniref:hypothetical protein n=1 Tax=Thermogemmatispora sp. TaxID=1968838 RepID=UPI0035E45D42